MMLNKKHRVLVIDFGSQYVPLIASKVRGFSVYSEIISCLDKNLLKKAQKFDAIILSGGPESVNNPNYLLVEPKIFELGLPILGICYGMQITHKLMGGEINTNDFSEFGESELTVDNSHPLFADIPEKSQIISSHYDSVVKLADGFKTIAKTKICIAATANEEKKIYTLQFHPEIEGSEYGTKIIENFLFKISNLQPLWNLEDTLQEKKKYIIETAQNRNILLAVSGGIDSSVVAELLHISVSNSQIFPIFIDNGLLLNDQKSRVIKYFSEKFKNFKFIDAKERFLNALEDVSDPQEKRTIIGKLFIQIFNEHVESIKDKNIEFLAQGTLYSDLIESGQTSDHSQTIKYHHNVVGLKEKNNFSLLEPLANLFKDEVKVLGKSLKLPAWIFNQQPFPGPGLAIRICGAVTDKKLDILRRVNSVFLENIQLEKSPNLSMQYFAILLAEKSVAVKGDERCYGYTIVLRIIESKNFMTANVPEVNFQSLKNSAKKIINQVSEVSRVLYDITDKPPGTIEWE